jgi:hypothetical protein
MEEPPPAGAARPDDEAVSEGRSVWPSWLRRHLLLVGSGLVAALIASGVSFGYWYFGQRPIEEKAERQTAERQAARDAYQDSRRMVVDCGPYRGREGWSARQEAAQRRATRVHNRGWRLMRSGHYVDAVATFAKAQEMLVGCAPLP